MLRLIITFLFISIFGVAQNSNNGIDFSEKKNLILLKNNNDRNQFFKVNNIVINRADKFYRFWDTTYCIEVSVSDNEIDGKVIFAVKNVNKESGFYRRIFSLDHQQVEQIFKLINNSELNALPTGNKIFGWTSGFDGNIFDIESNINGIYTYKSYWTPQIQSISEAKKIMAIKDDLIKIIKLEDLIKQFDETNPFSSYRPYGVSYSVIKFQTKEEKERTKRKNRPKKTAYILPVFINHINNLCERTRSKQ